MGDICHAQVRTADRGINVQPDGSQPRHRCRVLGLLIYRQLQARPVRGNQASRARPGRDRRDSGGAVHREAALVVGCHQRTGGIGNATLVLYLAVTLGVQRLIVVLRAQPLDPSAFGRVGRGAT
jgi:hypothetical protein